MLKVCHFWTVVLRFYLDINLSKVWKALYPLPIISLKGSPPWYRNIKEIGQWELRESRWSITQITEMLLSLIFLNNLAFLCSHQYTDTILISRWTSPYTLFSIKISLNKKFTQMLSRMQQYLVFLIQYVCTCEWHIVKVW